MSQPAHGRRCRAPWPSGAVARALRPLFAALALGSAAGAAPAVAESEPVRVAVVANFIEPAKAIAAQFKAKTGHEVAIVSGSTGSLFNQIAQGAPFEVFLSADQARPKAAVEQGLAVPGSQFSFAIGQLALWSDAVDVSDGPAVLKSGKIEKLALTNPEVGPGGVAAIETMKALGVYEAMQPKIVLGNTIAQVFQFVASRNADAGFVSLAQLHGVTTGTRWVVPETLHHPIRQDAVLLKSGADDEAARAFLEFLKGPEARAIIRDFDFALP